MRLEDAKKATEGKGETSSLVSAPAVQLPKGGGAIKGMGEKFAANPVTGTGSMSVPIATSPGRAGFGPQLSLNYDSGAGNGPFGLGWNLSLSSITRKTDKGLPRYLYAEESDVFILSGAEDLVPVLDDSGHQVPSKLVKVYGTSYLIATYRPRIEGLFALIECWTETSDPANTCWRTISRDNVTTWYGQDAGSRIFDPADPGRIFQWLICQTNDDKGNVAVYEYVDDKDLPIDTWAVWEANRDPRSRQANRYLKRILYGNPPPSYLPKLDPDVPDELPTEWMFEVVFDYDDHFGEFPTSQADDPPDSRAKLVRSDAFSTHRAGFEIRTYRLCQRVLMFHRFPDVPDVGPSCLVRSTNFDYVRADASADASKPGYAVLHSVTQWSFQKTPAGSNKPYRSRQLPPVVFNYSESAVNQVAQTIDADQLENLPVGTQGPGYQWIDLDGEGLSGVLSEQQGAWYYKPNLGEGTFGPMRVVARQPAMALAQGSRHQFLDLAGNGEIDVVDFSGPAPGFHERDRDEGWKRHVPFASLPNIDWQDPNLRFVDLTGDGHADALITEQEVFTWYPSLDERGFAASERTRVAGDEDADPRLVFADGTQTIFLADMSGDGLTDLVRIRNGEVCYWPNLGYGRFDRKVTLGNSPRFDHPDLFDPRRIRLADIDGSGPIDLIYLGRDGARLYFNRSGNSLSDALTVNLPVATDNIGAVQVADLLGNGTACLVWNSHLPADTAHPVRYIDLMGGQKPHLLVKVDNNLGATTEIEYTPSTRFYLQDQQAGQPWITRLPFPVHCVSRVTIADQWRGTAFSSTYSYHHGYFDGIEREFRGFGRVEVLDVERYDKTKTNNIGSPWVTNDYTLYQPPVKSVTWYHTGAALDRQRILDQFAHEYFPQRYAARLPKLDREPDAFHEKSLPQPELPAGLDADEWREALRACKGMVLRQETYELDVDELTGHTPKHTPVRLFSAATHNCNIQRIQPRGANKHAVFLVTESEALTYHYELDLHGSTALQPDPRIAHTLNLRHDEYGNPQQSVAVGYGRWQPGEYGALPRPELIAQVQGEMHIAYSETRYTSDVVLPKPSVPPALTDKAIRHHRLRLPFEALSYELKGIAKADARYYAMADFLACDLSEFYGHRTHETPPPAGIKSTEYHEHADSAVRQKRLVEHASTRYFDDGSDTAPPTAALAFGSHGPRGFKYEDYKLALTRDLLHAVFESKLLDRVNATLTAQQMLDDPKISGYIHGADIAPAFTGQYWMRSGTAGFSAEAHKHFYLANEFIDPFGSKTTLTYDSRDLFILSTKDALGNTSGIWLDGAGATAKPRFDYRVLAPIEMVDANGNRSEVYFDTLGMVVAAAVKGKGSEADDLIGFDYALANPSTAAVQAFCTATEMNEVKARAWLGRATARFVYHFGDVNGAWNQRMAGACGIARETHKDPASKLQVSLECSDGSGNVLMKKVQAEPDPDTGATRWIVNGLTILNNKGKPVKQFEPNFTPDFGCEMPTENGVSTTTYYDATGRVMRVEMPDGTFSRVEFSPWFSRSFDANDTVLEPECTWYSKNGRNRFAPATPLPMPIPGITDPPRPDERAGWLAAQHANTPAETHFDSLGREVIAIAHNRTPDAGGIWHDERYFTFTKLDAEGKPLWIRDARGNLVMQYVTPPKPTRLAATPVNPRDTTDTSGEYLPAGSAPCYDIAGNLLFQHSMDAGDRWMLMDAAGKPMLAWDVNDRGAGTPIQKRLFRTEYDALHRPTAQWLKIDNTDPVLVEAFEYCDTSQPNLGGGLSDAKKFNLIGQAIRHWDPSGKAAVERIDLSGKPAHITRTLILPDADGGTGLLSWDVANRDSLLETETFHQITEYDALGRMTTLYNWHRDAPDNRVAVYVPSYNERGLLKAETLDVGASKTSGGHTPSVNGPAKAIKKIRYNEKGQKEELILADGKTTTTYTYDEETYRLTTLRTTRTSGGILQALAYTYDPVGNITHIEDAAQETVFTNNSKIEPKHEYTYDALYRLIEASGRENAAALDPPPNREDPWPNNGFPSTDASRKYTQSYVYDRVGNFVEMAHLPSTGPGWTRRYATQPDSNRMYRTWYGAPDWDHAAPDQRIEYRHDIHGNMLNLNRTVTPPPLKQEEIWGLDIQWDWRDMIRGFDAIGGGIATYHYGIDKQRTRKHITRIGGVVEDRIYLGGYELYRRRNSETGPVVEEIESLHLFEGAQRVLLVDDVISTDNAKLPVGPLSRYQYGNHLGSVALELDDQAQIISYEEFHSYGTSAYRLMNGAREVPPKRYRYTGMERDEESGLSYHSARYYLPWLGRWSSSDPSGTSEGKNLFCYCFVNPIKLIDRDGRRPATSAETAYIDYLRDVEATAETHFAKLSLLGQVGDYFLGSNEYAKAASLASFERKALAEAIANAKEGEAVVPFVNDIGQTDYMTKSASLRAERVEREFQTLSNIAGGIGGTVGYFLGDDRGSDIGAVVDSGLLMFSPHPLNSQQVVGAPDESIYQHGAPTHSKYKDLNPETQRSEGTPLVVTSEERANRIRERLPVMIARVRKFFRLPEGSNTEVGFLFLPGLKNALPIKSGHEGGPWVGNTQRGHIPRGRGNRFSSGAPSEKNLGTHVEGHAIQAMWETGSKVGVLVVGSEPCGVCAPNIAGALPAGSELWIWHPDSQNPGSWTVTLYRSSTR